MENNMKHLRSIFAPSVLTVISLLAAGCARNYNAQVKPVMEAWTLADYGTAAQEATAVASKQKSNTDRDAIIWRLEQGAALRASGQFKESIEALNAAEEGATVFEDPNKAQAVFGRVIATLSNPTVLPYEGYAYDKIMINTYKAANYIQLGDFENARVELNSALEKQTDAQKVNDARIARAQEVAKEKGQNIDVEEIRKDAKFSVDWKTYYRNLEEMKFYADYVNPFTEYLRGLFFLYQPSGGADLQEARKSFENVLGMVGENKFIVEDLKTAEQAAVGQPISPTTYVIFETGRAPVRTNVSIHIPLILATMLAGKSPTQTAIPPYMGIAFPLLVFQEGHVSALGVTAGDVNETTAVLSNMDSVIGREFKNDFTRVMMWSLTSAFVKAGITYGADAALKDQEAYIRLLVKLALSFYAAYHNVADLRTWNTLPKQIQFCRVPTPADRKLELACSGSGPRQTVTLDDGLINLVWVKSINGMSGLQITKCKLR